MGSPRAIVDDTVTGAADAGVAQAAGACKWKPCLVHNIRQGLRRPSELHRLNQGAAPRVLNQQLRELEGDGVVRKVVHPVLPPKAEYFLTPLGESLLPIVDAMRGPTELPPACTTRAFGRDVRQGCAQQMGPADGWWYAFDPDAPA